MTMVGLLRLAFLGLLLLLPTSGVFSQQQQQLQQRGKLGLDEYPSELTLRAGVLVDPPFATIQEDWEEDELAANNRTRFFGGFQIDFLERLQIFAAQDNVALHLDLSQAPARYVDAFNLIANDCNTTDNPNPKEDCDKYDLILGYFASNADRYMRADLTQPWLHTSMTTIKYLDKPEGSEDFTTLTQAEEARATVCVPDGTFIMTVAMEKFPGADYIKCQNANDECITWLKEGKCVLFVMDELILHSIASNDPSLEVTRESFNTQYVVWPMREDLGWRESKLLKKWIYRAIQNATLDELYFQYFKKALCPAGTAGENCELPCHPEHGTADARGVCVCISTKWEGDDCSIEVQEDLNLLPTTLVAICYGLAGTSYLISFLCGAWVFVNRNNQRVKVFQPSFLFMVLLGCVISTSTIIALGQQGGDPGSSSTSGGGSGDASCIAIPWLYSVGFSITFGSLFAHIWRIYTLLTNAIQMRRVEVTTRDTMMAVAVVLLIDVVILTVWTIVSPLRWERTVTRTDQFGIALESEAHCTSEHWEVFAGIIAIFHVGLMTYACYICYLARSIPDSMSNGKYVSIAMFSNLQILVVALPVLAILGSDPQASFVVSSLAIWINDLAVVIAIFGSLIYRVFKFEREAMLASQGKRTKQALMKASLQRSTIGTVMRGSSGFQIQSIRSSGVREEVKLFRSSLGGAGDGPHSSSEPLGYPSSPQVGERSSLGPEQPPTMTRGSWVLASPASPVILEEESSHRSAIPDTIDTSKDASLTMKAAEEGLGTSIEDIGISDTKCEEGNRGAV